MKKLKNYKLLSALIMILASAHLCHAQPKISFSFDDGITADRPGYAFSEWNALLLQKLAENEVKAILFASCSNLLGAKGKHLLNTWNENGHLIANHTLNHPSYNSTDISTERFEKEFLDNDSIIKAYSNYVRLFRFPYLKEGNTPEKVENFRKFLRDKGYNNGHVTIDASDWYIDSRLIKKLRENPDANIEAYKKYYLDHIWERAQFYEALSYKINKRHINHTLLLHHNLLAALFIDELVQMFQEKGWTIVSAEQAYTDPVYQISPAFAGESLIYALAKDAKIYETSLRYPAEDSKYEEKKMKELGL